ncbi:MAG: type II toxin-antitoxin system prevent-host-death family antitoxin [Gammaproteobacteria bacterium]
MPSNTATANLALRVVRGGKRVRATSATIAKPAAPKKPAKPATIAAKGELTAVVDAAKSAPVTITLDGKPAAVVLDARVYRKLERMIRKLAEQEEDRWCIEQWQKAEKEGFLTPAENAAFIRRMRDAFGT